MAAIAGALALGAFAFSQLPAGAQGGAAEAPGVAGTTPQTPQEAARISVAELQALVAKGDAVLLDVRNASAYEASHARDAISIPLGELEAKLSQLPKDKLIAAYCT